MLTWLASIVVRGPHADLIRFDLEDLYLRERARGMSRVRASARYARRVFESVFHVWRGDRMPSRFRGGSMFQDLQFALRLFRKHPAPIGIAIVGLAMAIGVVTSIFTLADAATLRPYGMDEPTSVVSVTWTGHHFSDWSYSTFVQMREQATLTRVESSSLRRVRVSAKPALEDAATRWMLFVSGGYLQTFGGRPSVGRALEPADDLPGAPPVVVLSHQLWATQLDADPMVVGQMIWLNGVGVTVVGVLRPDFTGPNRTLPSVWAPFSAFDDVVGGPALGPDAKARVGVMARVIPGAGTDAAQQELDAIAKRTILAATGVPVAPELSVQLNRAAAPIDQDNAADAYAGLAILAGILGLVLAVACANTANLLLAAATARTPEIGVRLALGASAGRLVRQLISESLLLGLTAGGLGFLLAIWFVPILGAALETSMQSNAAPDGRALFFTIVLAVLCGVGAGLSPARHAARRSVLPALKSQGGANGRGPSRLRTSFIGFQAAASMLLLVCAALLARSAVHLANRDVGYDIDRLIVVSNEGLPKELSEAAYTQAALEALRQVKGVEHVSVVQPGPFAKYGNERDRFTRGGRVLQLNVMRSDADFFRTAGLRIVRGRAFTVDEVTREAPVALVSEAVGREFFGGSDPVGQSLSAVVTDTSFRQESATIIGVVADALLGPVRTEMAGTIYRPLSQSRIIPPVLVARTISPGLSAHGAEGALRRIDARVRPTTTIVREELDAFLDVSRMFAWMSAPIALIVVLLAGVGVFGVTAFVVGQRLQEMSLRVAIGASPADLLRLLLKDSLRPVAVGLVVGLAGALLVGRLSVEYLGGISPNDPIALAGAISILLGGALLAVIIPARRAAKADPAKLLRSV